MLSLFDGMSCGRIAAERAGLPIANYYASEINKYAIQISHKNYPDIIRLGDVTKWKEWNLPEIDLLIAGSPCQGFSMAGKRLNFDDPRSKLFFDFVDILKAKKPKYFLLENVRMLKEWENIISEQVGIEPALINSALVSAQNRERLYWTNINAGKNLFGNLLPGIAQPEDKGVLLKDILEDGTGIIHENLSKNKTLHIEKSCALRANASANYQTVYPKMVAGRMVGRNPENSNCRKTGEPGAQTIEINRNPQKTNCLSSVSKDNILIPVIKNYGKWKPKPDKSQCLDANYYKGPDNRGQRTMICIGLKEGQGYDIDRRIYSPNGIAPTLMSNATGGTHHKLIGEDKNNYRKLTPIECERLQTVPDNYTESVSTTQRYKMLGNGWTIDVIAHIFSFIKLNSHGIH